MISKKHFLAQMKKLMVVFDEQVPDKRLMAYYDVMAPDFTDEQFDAAINLALKNSFKFPPIAAFYKGAEPAAFVPDPVTKEESEAIQRARVRYGLD